MALNSLRKHCSNVSSSTKSNLKCNLGKLCAQPFHFTCYLGKGYIRENPLELKNSTKWPQIDLETTQDTRGTIKESR